MSGWLYEDEDGSGAIMAFGVGSVPAAFTPSKGWFAWPEGASTTVEEVDGPRSGWAPIKDEPRRTELLKAASAAVGGPLKPSPKPAAPVRAEQPHKVYDPTPWLNHPLNKAALALLKKHKTNSRELSQIMPVRELCLSAIAEEEIDSPKGIAYLLTAFRDPKELLPLIEETISPADLIEADDLETAGDMVLRRLMKIELSGMPEFRAWDFY